MIKFIRQTKVLVSFENCKHFYHVMADLPRNSKIELVRYNAALAITGAIKCSSHEKLYQELGLEYLYQRRWARRLLTL